MKRIVALLCALILLFCVSSCGSKDKKVVLIPQNFYDFFKVKSSVNTSGGEDAGWSKFKRTNEVSYEIEPLIPLQVEQDISVTFSIGSSKHPEHFGTLTSKCVISEDGKGSGTISFFDWTQIGANFNPFGDAVIEIESIDGYVLLDPDIYQSLQMKR